MKIVESIHIEQEPDGESSTGSKLTVRVSGSHETEHPANQSSIAYLIAMGIVSMINDGTVLERVNKLFGLDLTGEAQVKSE